MRMAGVLSLSPPPDMGSRPELPRRIRHPQSSALSKASELQADVFDQD